MAVLRLVPSQGAPTPVEITKDKVVVGREPTCDVVVNDGSVSRKHAIIERRGDRLGDRRPGQRQRHLRGQPARDRHRRCAPASELRFGAMAYRVEIEGDDQGATILTGAPERDGHPGRAGEAAARDPPPAAPRR